MSSNLSPIDEVSEDMDFSLIEKDESVHIENYFQPIVDELKAIGMHVEIVKKDKKTFGRVESAFLKENTFKRRVYATAKGEVGQYRHQSCKTGCTALC